MNPLDELDLSSLEEQDPKHDPEKQAALGQLTEYTARLEEREAKSELFNELLKSFNKNSYYLRAGLLGKQYLQGLPNFRAQTELDQQLAELYDSCGGVLSKLSMDEVGPFIKDWLVPALAKSGALKAQRTNRKWPSSYAKITADEKAQLSLTWRSLATGHIRSLPQEFAEHYPVPNIASRLSELTNSDVTPQLLVGWLFKEDKITQAAGTKDYAVAYLNLCFSLYAEMGAWDSLAKYFDPKGETEAEGFSEMDREITEFAALLSADGILGEL